ncbi:hypothetical protein [Micromonospora humida]|uniref:hypothetical protein n=1 Tax=Micromonospora humida TaxID=2809018 RepID=UPI003445588A
MAMLGYRLTQVLGHLPILLTLLTVLVLGATAGRRLPGRSRSFLLAGAAILLLLELFTTAWVAALPELIRSGGIRQYQTWSLAVSLVGWIGYPVGLGLIVTAVFVGRTAPPSPVPGQPWGTWTPPAGGPPTGHPGGPPPGYAAGQAAEHPGRGAWGGSDHPPAAPPQADHPPAAPPQGDRAD